MPNSVCFQHLASNCRRLGLLGVLAAVLVAAPAVAQVPAPEAWPVDFTAFPCGGVVAFDKVSDAPAGIKERDVVGDAAHAGAAWTTDGKYLFVQLRLDESPLVSGGSGPLAQFAWGMGIDADGNTSNGPLQLNMPISASNASDTAALRHLWARHRIAALNDQESLEGGNAAREAITELGLKYSLLTQYTSFLAVDQVVRNKSPADSTSVNQPLPLPQGVENSALGAQVPSTPEPATWGAMLVTISVLAMLAVRRRRAQARAHHYTF